MKKRLPLVLLIAALLFILTSCGNSEYQNATSSEESHIDQGSHAMGDMVIFESVGRVFEFLMMFYEEDLTESIHVVRAKMMDERIERIDIVNIGAYENRPISHVRILDVFLGGLQVGEVIEVVRSNFQSNHSLTGEDLILFLTHDPERASGYHVLVTAFQAAYRIPPSLAYPQSIISSILTRTIPEDMILEPLSPHNNLVLTIQDLARIAGLCDSPWPQPPTRQPEMYPYLVPHTDGFIEVEIRP